MQLIGEREGTAKCKGPEAGALMVTFKAQQACSINACFKCYESQQTESNRRQRK